MEKIRYQHVEEKLDPFGPALNILNSKWMKDLKKDLIL